MPSNQKNSLICSRICSKEVNNNQSTMFLNREIETVSFLFLCYLIRRNCKTPTSKHSKVGSPKSVSKWCLPPSVSSPLMPSTTNRPKSTVQKEYSETWFFSLKPIIWKKNKSEWSTATSNRTSSLTSNESIQWLSLQMSTRLWTKV